MLMQPCSASLVSALLFWVLGALCAVAPPLVLTAKMPLEYGEISEYQMLMGVSPEAQRQLPQLLAQASKVLGLIHIQGTACFRYEKKTRRRIYVWFYAEVPICRELRVSTLVTVSPSSPSRQPHANQAC